MQQINIPLAKLLVSPLNARKDLHAGQEDSGIDELASSIQRQGLLSPPIVRPTADGKFEVLVGQRRFLACGRIGLDPVPCLVREDLGDADAVTMSLVENVHRADMHPLDKARALKALYDRHGSYDRVAKESAWSVSTISKYIKLLLLPDVLQRRLSTSEGPSGVGTLARLATTFSGEEAVEAYDKISGFTQRVQDEILKRSDGDLATLDELVIEAQDGAFNLRRCGGRYECEIIRDIIEQQMSQADFQRLVGDVARNCDLPKRSDKNIKDAARAFWKALAAG